MAQVDSRSSGQQQDNLQRLIAAGAIDGDEIHKLTTRAIDKINSLTDEEVNALIDIRKKVGKSRCVWMI